MAEPYEARVPEMAMGVPQPVDENVDGARVQIRGNRATVDFNPGMTRTSNEDSDDHVRNLALDMSTGDQAELVNDIIDRVDADLKSRADWQTRVDQAMELLGLRNRPGDDVPFEGASSVSYPLIGEACVQFQARAIEEVFPSEGPCKTKVIGKRSVEKEEQAERVKAHMNYQMLDQDRAYFWHTDQMLFWLPVAGSAFKKTYYDPISDMVVSRLVFPNDLIVPYIATDLRTSPRITHRLWRTDGDLKRLMANGFYQELDLSQPYGMDTEDSQDSREIADEADDRSENLHDKDFIYEILECHIDLEIKDDQAKYLDSDGERVGRLRRELGELVGAADADALLSDVSSGDELLASLGPAVGLARVARGEMSRGAYLEQWGHRGPLEVETSVPRPFEGPDWLDRQLAAYAQSPVDVEALLSAQRARFDAAWERFRDRYPRQARSMRRRLEETAEAIRVREAVRSEFTRFVWVARTWALQVGELTGIGDGVFFLTFEKLLDLLAGQEAPTATIPARRETYERYRALPPYPLVISGRFDPFQWAADPDRRSDQYDTQGRLPPVVKAAQENVILGMPGSAGQVEGLVRRLNSPEEGDQLAPGEILVTSQTNIGWTLLFPRAAAIVTDIGAPLSHAAVVARELGIPAVVNCGSATMRLRTGDRVRVDGAQGTVEILSGEA